MKKTTLSLLLAAVIVNTSCLGSFNAFNGLKDWNSELTDNKFVNNLVFWALNIIPVYGVAGLLDVAVFNVIEFWSGNNPISMKEGDIETQIVKKNGKKYEITATKNKFDIEVLEGENKGEKMSMTYEPQDKSWNAITPQGEKIKLSSYKDGFIYVYTPTQTIKVDANLTKEEGIAYINTQIINSYFAVK